MNSNKLCPEFINFSYHVAGAVRCSHIGMHVSFSPAGLIRQSCLDGRWESLLAFGASSVLETSIDESGALGVY